MFSFTFFGYGAILLKLEKHLLFNPGILDKTTLVDTTKVVPSYVLVSYHSKELLGNAHEFPHKHGSIIIGSAQVSEQMRKAGIQKYLLEELSDQQTLKLGGDIELTGYFVKRGGFFAPRSLAFSVKSKQGHFLYLGIAKEISPFRKAEPDLLCVPVGGKPYGTLDAEEAVSVTQTICPRYAFPICGDEEPRVQYIELLKTQESGIIPIVLSAGDTYTLL